jgi:glutamyl-tRNA synthetase
VTTRPELPARGAGRFAPTPTGLLHIGNARTALLAWLAARRAGLRQILRVEDLDPVAMRPEILRSQYDDLDWLGLEYDEEPRRGGPHGPYRQSERHSLYDAALAELDALGLLYPCWCSRKEVLAASRAPHASDEGPVYPGTCRPRAPAPLGDLSALPERGGRKPSVRLDVARALAHLGLTEVAWTDRAAGLQRFDLRASQGDFVVRRTDGIASYQIACAWDDAAMGCTQVVRGEDLLPSAARQWLLLRLWDLPVPEYAHVGLVTDAEGRRLSKRDGDTALAHMREHGRAASDVLRQLARMSGLPDTADLDALTEAFALEALTAEARRL